MSFELRPLSPDDPFVRFALRRYLAKWRIGDVEQQPVKSWWGLFEGESIALAFAYMKRGDGGIELTDVYLDPNRAGLRAIIYAGRALREALAQGVFPYVMVSTFRKNRRAQRWLQQYVGKTQPDCLAYVIPGAALDPERAKVLA